MDELCFRGCAILAEQEKHVISGWSDVSISRCPNGQTTMPLFVSLELHVALVHVECVRHRPGPDQHDRIHTSCMLVGYLKGLAISQAWGSLPDLRPRFFEQIVG
jgi:hypothetical protein